MLRLFARCLLLLLGFVATASGAAPDALPYKAVLIAGDWSAAAFDHATEALQQRLLAHHVAPADVQRLSAARAELGRDGVESSTLGHVIAAIEHMQPAAGQACLVFATSHGAYGYGFVLVPSQDFLTPVVLNDALNIGCGNAPTVVIISSCFSGSFARPPMTRPNRIILTAARPDRTSFGCGAGFQYTVYDNCLLQAMDHADSWQTAFAMIKACVAKREKALRIKASEPQASFGGDVAGSAAPAPP